MTALPRHAYRDPLEILLQKEARYCKGCVHRLHVWGKEGCNKGRKPRRCKDYKEKEGTR